MFQIKVLLPRKKKKVKSRKGEALRRGCTLVSFSKPSGAGWASSVSGHSSVSVSSATSAAAAFTFASDPAPLAQNHLNPQPLWFCLCLFGLLSVIVYSNWDSQSIYHCHHVTAAKPPFPPKTEDFWQLWLSTEMQSSRLSAAFQISQDSVWAVNRNFRIENQVIPPYHKPKLSSTY